MKYLNDIEVSKLAEFEKRLYEFMDTHAFEALVAIRTTGKLEKDTEDMLKSALNELKKEFTVAE